MGVSKEGLSRLLEVEIWNCCATDSTSRRDPRDDTKLSSSELPIVKDFVRLKPWVSILAGGLSWFSSIEFLEFDKEYFRKNWQERLFCVARMHLLKYVFFNDKLTFGLHHQVNMDYRGVCIFTRVTLNLYFSYPWHAPSLIFLGSLSSVAIMALMNY